ncbi:hypothetical protein LTR53_014225 [Teratosphaeriaceae sp. CCFEE 6253]|nr:hypothetical protein LTR53_014225 [Teratosphaeriaceae sp. CCFEE 6253]
MPADPPTDQIRPAPSPLLPPPPPLPSHDVLTAEQWGILAAIADTVVPSFTPQEGNRLLQHPLRTEIYEASCRRLEQSSVAGEDGRALVASYLAESGYAQKEFRDGLTGLINVQLHEEARKQLRFILTTLGPQQARWRLPPDRLCHPPRLPPHPDPRADPAGLAHRPPAPAPPTPPRPHHPRHSPLDPHLPHPRPRAGLPRHPIPAHPLGPSYPFTFLQIPPSLTPEPELLHADVVIVGSGCGGAVAARLLAEAGMKVLLVDEAYHWPPAYLPMSESAAAAHLFANGGALQSDGDSSLALVAGRAWGGGGTVNWSAALQTPGPVRREWAGKFGLGEVFAGAGFQGDLEAVCERMGVGTAAIAQNEGNRVLLEGARKLGWSAKAVPQNTGGAAH